jgi:hypothetical protein
MALRATTPTRSPFRATSRPEKQSERSGCGRGGLAGVRPSSGKLRRLTKPERTRARSYPGVHPLEPPPPGGGGGGGKKEKRPREIPVPYFPNY